VKSYLSIHTKQILLLRVLLCLFMWQHYQLLNTYIDLKQMNFVSIEIRDQLLDLFNITWKQNFLSIPWQSIQSVFALIALICFAIGYKTRSALLILLVYSYAIIRIDPNLLLRMEGQFLWGILILIGIPWWSYGSIDIIKQQLELRSDEGDQQLNEPISKYRPIILHSSMFAVILMTSTLSSDLFIMHHPQWHTMYFRITVLCISCYLIPHWSLRSLVLAFSASQVYACDDLRSLSFFCISLPLLFPMDLWKKLTPFLEKMHGKHLYVFYDAKIGFLHQLTRVLKRIDASHKVLWLGSSTHPFMPIGLSIEVLQVRRTQGLVIYQPHTQRTFYDFEAVCLLTRIIPVIGPLIYGITKILMPLLNRIGTRIYIIYTRYRRFLPGQSSLEITRFEQESTSNSMEGALRTQLVKVLSLNHQNKTRCDELDDTWYEQVWQGVGHLINITLILTLLIQISNIPHQLLWGNKHPWLIRAPYILSQSIHVTEDHNLKAQDRSLHDAINPDDTLLLYIQTTSDERVSLTISQVMNALPYANPTLPYFMIYTQKNRYLFTHTWLYVCEALKSQVPHLQIKYLIFPSFKYQEPAFKIESNYNRSFQVSRFKVLNQMRWRCPFFIQSNEP
jgi:hypothetical protein